MRIKDMQVGQVYLVKYHSTRYPARMLGVEKFSWKSANYVTMERVDITKPEMPALEGQQGQRPLRVEPIKIFPFNRDEYLAELEEARKRNEEDRLFNESFERRALEFFEALGIKMASDSSGWYNEAGVERSYGRHVNHFRTSGMLVLNSEGLDKALEIIRRHATVDV